MVQRRGRVGGGGESSWVVVVRGCLDIVRLGGSEFCLGIGVISAVVDGRVGLNKQCLGHVT